MKPTYLGIKFALSYFTLLPVRFRESDDLSHPRTLETMVLTLPLIGVVLASLTIALFGVIEPLGWLGALIAAVTYMMLYGFIHTEAILDVADALYAAHSGKDPYVIIKEPTVGAMGVLYGGGFLILKLAALSTLLMHHYFLPFIAIALISRFGLVFLIHYCDFRSSFVSQLHESVRFLPTVLLVVFCVWIGFYTLSWLFTGLFFLGILSSFFLSHLAKKSLGFINGDVLGMALEVTELILFITVLLTWS